MIERNNEAIAQLKNLLDQELLSVIVGAGFSKNASSKFLSWKELLKEMILEMYEFNAKQSYEYSRIRGTRCESKFWETFINQVIREKGYLSIASEYVKRYGYREVIDEYIEKKTPLIDDENEKEYNLDIHKLLLDIQWNNVYTFNYDNLLEKAAGEEYKIISCEINNLEKRICKIDENISEYEEELRRAEELIEKDTEKTNIDTSNEKLNRNFSKKSSEGADQVKLKNEKSVIDDDVKCLKNEKINIKFTIDRKKKLQRNTYCIVEDSSELSIRKRKNIIKLHGTRNSNNKGFDNDPNCKYIITEEDYLEYDKKHDAFVNLMRIALLQDSFCLIGFSGDDPNFMSWLKWVRNVLDRKANKENYKKIYFVDVSGKPLSTSKKLFFQNHYIQHVPLFDSDENVNEASIKERLTEFLKELNRESYTENIYKHGNYLWENYKFNISDVEYLHGININEIRETWEYRHYNSLPSLKQDFIGAKQRILIEIKQKFLKTNNLEENSARLFVMAIKDDFLPLDLIIDSDIYENLNIIMKRYDDVYNEFKYLHIRCLNLNGKDISSFNDYSDSYKYESILNSAFNLDFKLLKSRLEEWQPDDLRFKRKKIAFLTLFRYLEYSDYSSFFEKELGTNNQEYFYFLETLQRATYISRFNRSEINQVDEIKEKIDNENKDQNHIDDNVEYLKEKINKEKLHILPYNDTSVTHYYGSTSQKYSIQAVQVFIETGLPLYRDNVNFYKKEDWYSIFKNIYTIYPYPCLFFSLQYGNESKFIKRISEDYAYCNQLRKIHSSILLCVLKAYQDENTPSNIKNGVLAFAQIFFKMIPASVWRSHFETIAKTILEQNTYRDTYDEQLNFLTTGFTYTSGNAFKVETINRILSLGNKIDQKDNSLLIAAKENLKDKYIDQVNSKLIERLIDDAKDTSHYFILFNLKSTITSKLWAKLISQLYYFDFVNCNEVVMFNAASFYAKKNTKLSIKIESSIVKSELLWSTGIIVENNMKRIGFGGQFLRINTIQESLIFSKQTIFKIFNKLVLSIDDICEVLNNAKNDNIIELSNWTLLLLEMDLFLKNNSRVLSKESNFSQTVEKVKSSYHQLSDVDSIFTAIISDDARKVREGIQNLVYRVESSGVKNLRTEYIVIANRIIIKQNAALQSCLVHFASVLKTNHPDFDNEIFMPLIDKMLVVYSPYFSNNKAIWNIDAKKEDVEDAMIEINKVAKKYRRGHIFWNNHKRIFKN